MQDASVPRTQRRPKRADMATALAHCCNTPQLVVYFEQWGIYARDYPPAKLPINVIDEIAYAFGGVKDTYPEDVTLHDSLLTDTYADIEKHFSNNTGIHAGKDADLPYHGNFGEFLKMKQLGNKFQFTLSLGGWTGSGNFSAVLADDTKRLDLIERIDATMHFYNDLMTGIGIDWEYPSNSQDINWGAPGNTHSAKDKEHLACFLRELRHKLGSDKQISVAITNNLERMQALPFHALATYVDQVQLMSYDFASSAFGDQITAHATNLYKSKRDPATTPFSADEGVQALLQHGIQPHQIFIGVPLYSRGFANTDGLGKPCSGVTTDKSWEAGVLDYKAIPPHPSFIEAFDEEVVAAYAYSAEKRELLSYDSPESVKHKAQYVLDKKLGGIIVWAASSDAASAERSLLKTIRRTFDAAQ